MDDDTEECTNEACINVRSNLLNLIAQKQSDNESRLQLEKVQEENTLLRKKLEECERLARNMIGDHEKAIDLKEKAEADMKQISSERDHYKEQARIFMSKADEADIHLENANKFREKYDAMGALAEELEQKISTLQAKFTESVRILNQVQKKNTQLSSSLEEAKNKSNDMKLRLKGIDKYGKDAIQIIDELSCRITIKKNRSLLHKIKDFRKPEVRTFFGAEEWKDPRDNVKFFIDGWLEEREDMIDTIETSSETIKRQENDKLGLTLSDDDDDEAAHQLECLMSNPPSRPDINSKFNELRSKTEKAPAVKRVNVLATLENEAEAPAKVRSLQKSSTDAKLNFSTANLENRTFQKNNADTKTSFASYQPRAIFKSKSAASDFDKINEAANQRRKDLICRDDPSSSTEDTTSSIAKPVANNSIHGRKGKSIREIQSEMKKVSAKDVAARLKAEMGKDMKKSNPSIEFAQTKTPQKNALLTDLGLEMSPMSEVSKRNFCLSESDTSDIEILSETSKESEAIKNVEATEKSRRAESLNKEDTKSGRVLRDQLSVENEISAIVNELISRIENTGAVESVKSLAKSKNEDRATESKSAIDNVNLLTKSKNEGKTLATVPSLPKSTTEVKFNQPMSNQKPQPIRRNMFSSKTPTSSSSYQTRSTFKSKSNSSDFDKINEAADQRRKQLICSDVPSSSTSDMVTSSTTKPVANNTIHGRKGKSIREIQSEMKKVSAKDVAARLKAEMGNDMKKSNPSIESAQTKTPQKSAKMADFGLEMSPMSEVSRRSFCLSESDSSDTEHVSESLNEPETSQSMEMEESSKNSVIVEARNKDGTNDKETIGVLVEQPSLENEIRAILNELISTIDNTAVGESVNLLTKSKNEGKAHATVRNIQKSTTELKFNQPVINRESKLIKRNVFSSKTPTSSSSYQTRSTFKSKSNSSDFDKINEAADQRRKQLICSDVPSSSTSEIVTSSTTKPVPNNTIHGRKGKSIREIQSEMKKVSAKDVAARLKAEMEKDMKKSNPSIESVKPKTPQKSAKMADFGLEMSPMSEVSRRSFCLSESDSSDTDHVSESLNEPETSQNMEIEESSKKSVEARNKDDTNDKVTRGVLVEQPSLENEIHAIVNELLSRTENTAVEENVNLLTKSKSKGKTPATVPRSTFKSKSNSSDFDKIIEAADQRRKQLICSDEPSSSTSEIVTSSVAMSVPNTSIHGRKGKSIREIQSEMKKVSAKDVAARLKAEMGKDMKKSNPSIESVKPKTPQKSAKMADLGLEMSPMSEVSKSNICFSESDNSDTEGMSELFIDDSRDGDSTKCTEQSNTLDSSSTEANKPIPVKNVAEVQLGKRVATVPIKVAPAARRKNPLVKNSENIAEKETSSTSTSTTVNQAEADSISHDKDKASSSTNSTEIPCIENTTEDSVIVKKNDQKTTSNKEDPKPSTSEAAVIKPKMARPSPSLASSSLKQLAAQIRKQKRSTNTPKNAINMNTMKNTNAKKARIVDKSPPKEPPKTTPIVSKNSSGIVNYCKPSTSFADDLSDSDEDGLRICDNDETEIPTTKDPEEKNSVTNESSQRVTRSAASKKKAILIEPKTTGRGAKRPAPRTLTEAKRSKPLVEMQSEKALFRQALDLKLPLAELKRPLEEKGFKLNETIPLNTEEAVEIMIDFLKQTTRSDMWMVVVRHWKEDNSSPLTNSDEESFLDVSVSLHDEDQLLLRLFIERILLEFSTLTSLNSAQCGSFVRLFCHSIRFVQADEEEKIEWMRMLCRIVMIKHESLTMKTIAYCLISTSWQYMEWLVDEISCNSDWSLLFRTLLYYDRDEEGVINWLLNDKFGMARVEELKSDDLLEIVKETVSELNQDSIVHIDGGIVNMKVDTTRLRLLSRSGDSELLRFVFAELKSRMDLLSKKLLDNYEDSEGGRSLFKTIEIEKVTENESKNMVISFEWITVVLKFIVAQTVRPENSKAVVGALRTVAPQIVEIKDALELAQDDRIEIAGNSKLYLRKAIHRLSDFISEFTHYSLIT